MTIQALTNVSVSYVLMQRYRCDFQKKSNFVRQRERLIGYQVNKTAKQLVFTPLESAFSSSAFEKGRHCSQKIQRITHLARLQSGSAIA